MSSWEGKRTNHRLPALLTQTEQPVSFLDDAADASRVDVPHKLPEQRTERRPCGHQLLHVRDANTDGLLCWSVLEVTYTEVKELFFTYMFSVMLLFLFFYLNIVDFLNSLGVFARGCQGVHGVRGNTAHSTFIQTGCDHLEAAGQAGIDRRTRELCGVLILHLLLK